MARFHSLLFAACLFLVACNGVNSQGQVKIVSQFQQAGLCDFLIDKAGIFHAVFQESTAYGKPTWIWYASSANRGATWSKPITVSNDNTGNGAGYPRILQDGAGNIYAIWKRYGNTAATYPQAVPNLDGPGGTDLGTVYYKVLNGGTWSQQVQVNEDEQAQDSWFATVSPQGTLYVFWLQVSQASLKNHAATASTADYLRVAALNGTTHSAITDLSKPEPPGGSGWPDKQKGGWNLQGYVDKAGLPHLLYEDKIDDAQVIKYYDGKSQRIAYKYVGYVNRNTYYDPAKLLVDEKGIDHMILMPLSTNLEDQQIWDINFATNQTNVLLHLPENVGTLRHFQATQGPNGAMAITFQSEKRLANTEAYGLFYGNGTWKGLGLTNNAAKDKVMSKNFIGIGGWPTNITTSTSYNSSFVSVAYDAAGKKSMLMTLKEHFLSSFSSSDYPSIVFMPIDR